MDRRAGSRALVLAVCLVLGSLSWAERNAPEDLMERALALQREGSAEEALDVLRSLRSEFADSGQVPRSLSLSSEICLQKGDLYRARYFLSALIASHPGSSEIYRTAMLIADDLYVRHSFHEALEYYAAAVRNADRGKRPPGLALALLRASELSLYQAGDSDGARTYFKRIEPEELPRSEARAYKTMAVRLNWEAMPPEKFGLSDANVSFIRADGDDIWIGTWNGGVARYSLSTGRSSTFVQPASTSRCIEVSGRRVWVGTSEGLSWYSKATGHWGSEESFSSPQPVDVWSLLSDGEDLYAGTLGSGLYRMREGRWTRIERSGLPGDFITSLAARGDWILIGTMTMGLIVMEKKSGRLWSLEEEYPGFKGENVTTVSPDRRGDVWIGTYGQGLYLWRPESRGLVHFNRESGELRDDWVLCARETPVGMYFGSFGGGVSLLEWAGMSWKRIGIAEGLTSLDVTSIERRGRYLFFGTLGGGVCRYLEEGNDQEF